MTATARGELGSIIEVPVCEFEEPVVSDAGIAVEMLLEERSPALIP